jgi:hypothetical protein
MPRLLILTILLLLAATLGFFALKTDPQFIPGLASQAFWMFTGVILTTFLLDALLKRERTTRERREQEFAFRSFTAFTLDAISSVVKLPAGSAEPVLEAAISGNRAFDQAIKPLVAQIESSIEVDGAAHSDRYLEIASRLRDLAFQHPRLFSRSEREMLAHFRKLHALAERWRYHDVLSRAGAAVVERATGEYREAKLLERTEAEREVGQASRETAAYLATLSEVVASGTAMGPRVD